MLKNKESLLRDLEAYRELLKCNRPTFLDWQKLCDDVYCICADIHCPYHSPFWVEKFIKMSMKTKLKKGQKRVCVIGGDFFQFDTFSKHKLSNPDDIIEYTYNAGGDILKVFLKVFDKIIITKGNHDKWIEIFTDGKMNSDHIFQMMDIKKSEFKEKIVLSNYPYLVINNFWRVTHPNNYSIVKGAVANKLSSKYEMGIINAHGHFLSMGYNTSGKYPIIDIGGLFDRKKIYYIMMISLSSVNLTE